MKPRSDSPVTRLLFVPIVALTASLLAACAGTQERAGGTEPGNEEGGPHRYGAYFGNLDFETGSESEGDEEEPAVAWKGGGAGIEFALETQGVHGGTYAARLQRVRDDVPAPNDFGVVAQWAAASPFHGKRLRLSGWIRSQDVRDGYCGLFIRLDGPGMRPVGYAGMELHPVQGTTGWKRYEVAVDIPKDAKGMCFGMVFEGKGTAWLDDLKFEAVPPVK